MQISEFQIFLEYFDKVHQRTLRVLRCIPADRVEWSFHPGKWTLGDLVRHMAAVKRHMFVETARGNPSRYAGCGRELADGLEAIVIYLDTMHRESAEILSRLSQDDLNRKCTTPDGASITVWKWLRLMVEHEIHHRGQIYTYLAMLEVATPPLYGLTSEQVRDHSVS